MKRVQRSPQPPFARVLVALANDQPARALAQLALRLVQSPQGELVAQQIVQVPEQTPPEHAYSLVERARWRLMRLASELNHPGVQVSLRNRLSHHLRLAIADAVRAVRPDLVLLGSEFESRFGSLGFGVRLRRALAGCPAVLVSPQHGSRVRRVLVPITCLQGGRLALAIAPRLMEPDAGGVVMALRLSSHTPSSGDRAELSERLAALKRAWVLDDAKLAAVCLEPEWVKTTDRAGAIVQHSREVDRLLLGDHVDDARRPRTLRGLRMQLLARRSGCPVLRVREGS